MKLVKIPSFIKIISSYSFSESIIQSITIPSSITKICQFAFFHCNNLQNVKVENNSELHTIEKSAFSNPLVESISIPSSVVEFAEGWCCDTPKLNKINVFINNNIENIKKIGDNLVVGKSNICNESFDVLLLSSRKIKKINIPPSIKIISSYAFSESEIESITIPNSVTQIDEGSFYFCKKMNKIIIENNSELTMIGKFAFYYSSIKSFSIPIHVTQICNEAFSYCEKLQIIEFNNHSDIKSIDENLINTCSHAIIMITSNQGWTTFTVEPLKINGLVKFTVNDQRCLHR